jgi:hypothetical protein
MTQAVSIAQGGNNNVTMRNRIINGAMVIDQRNAGAAVTVNTGARVFGVDRFFGYGEASDGVFTLTQDSSAPTGFTNSTKITVTTADASVGANQYYLFGQSIEGYNVADLGFGAAGASTVTLSFWVRSSLTGTFGGSLGSNGNGRSYPFTYTISAANTWEQKSVTIAGDTSGTWLKTNLIGFNIFWDLGCGSSNVGTANAWASAALFGATGDTKLISTNGATFYITGVQLEAGTTATPFENRLYGTELALCQRYYEKSYPIGTAPGASSITSGMSWLVNGYTATIYVLCTTTFKATKRTSATVTFWDAAGNTGRTTSLTGGGLSQVDNNNNIYATVATESGFFIYILAGSSLNYGVQWTASAEL